MKSLIFKSNALKYSVKKKEGKLKSLNENKKMLIENKEAL